MTAAEQFPASTEAPNINTDREKSVEIANRPERAVTNDKPGNHINARAWWQTEREAVALARCLARERAIEQWLATNRAAHRSRISPFKPLPSLPNLPSAPAPQTETTP